MSALPVARSAARTTRVRVAPGVPICFGNDLIIPAGIVDHESFREWARSDSFPEKSRISFYDNRIWVDTSMEQAYTHNLVKTEFAGVLYSLVKRLKSGHFFSDGMLLTLPQIGFTTVPDGIYISYDALDSKRVVEVEGKKGGCVEFVGPPEMVLEVISPFSKKKDTDFISLYFAGGVFEYWLVDVRHDAIRFDIYRRNSRKYVATRPQAGGWLKSTVFGHSFRLTRALDPRGKPLFTLEMKP